MTLIARLRILLNDVDPQPMRQIEVPLKIRLDRLHEVVQAAMGWTDTHLYEFRAGGAGWGVPYPDGFYDGPMPAKKATLQKVLEDTGARTLQYIYDFGDDWDHSIRIERVTEAAPGVTYPRLLKAGGASPPEDVGGAPGYEEFLEALADPNHEQHEDMVSRSGVSFDPEDARIDRIVERFDQLAKKWAPRPGKPKAPKATLCARPHVSGLRRMVTVEAILGREKFEREIRRRGFRAVENGGQFVIFCNRAPIRLIE